MTNPENCAFCDTSNLEWRLISEEELLVSFVSRPWFRPGHCLVVPKRHITTPAELESGEAATIMKELGRLATKLDEGYGSGIMQKYQPLQAENGVKVSHLHFHVFPRTANEENLFPTPEPNSFDGFIMPSDEEVQSLAASLRP